MTTKEKIGNELYVWIWERGLKKLLYKRWIDRKYGMVMDRQPFTTKDTESFNQSFIDNSPFVSSEIIELLKEKKNITFNYHPTIISVLLFIKENFDVIITCQYDDMYYTPIIKNKNISLAIIGFNFLSNDDALEYGILEYLKNHL